MYGCIKVGSNRSGRENNLNQYLSTATKAVQKCLQNYATFSGRATRPEFWYFFLFIIAANFIGNLFSDIIGTLLEFGLLLPYLAVAVRRMHDRNKSGWYVLVPLLNL